MTLQEIQTALRGMKLADVAYECRLHYNTVRRIASGTHKNPLHETVATLSEYIKAKQASQ